MAIDIMTMPAGAQPSSKTLIRNSDGQFPARNPSSKSQTGSMNYTSTREMQAQHPRSASRAQYAAQDLWTQSNTHTTGQSKNPHAGSHVEAKPTFPSAHAYPMTQHGGQSFTSHGPQTFRPINPAQSLNTPMQPAEYGSLPRAASRNQHENLMTQAAKRQFQAPSIGSQHPPQGQQVAVKKVNSALPIKSEGDVFGQSSEYRSKTPGLPSMAVKPQHEVSAPQPTLGSSAKRPVFQADASAKRSKKGDTLSKINGNGYDIEQDFLGAIPGGAVNEMLGDMDDDLAVMLDAPKKARDTHLFKIPPEFTSPEILMTKIDIKRIAQENAEISQSFEPEQGWDTANSLFDKAQTNASEVFERFDHIHRCFMQLTQRKDEVLEDKKLLSEEYQAARSNISYQSRSLVGNIGMVATKRRGQKGRGRSASAHPR